MSGVGRTVNRAAITAALALGSPLGAGEPWRPVTGETGQIGNAEGLEQLARDFPDSGSVRLRLLQPYLESGNTDKLLRTLRWLKDRGYVFGEASQQQIPKIVGEGYADAARALLIPQAEIIAASKVVATIPAEAGLVESVQRHPRTNRLVATSVTGKSLHMLLPNNVWANIPMPEVNDLSGIVWDTHSGLNWIASANLDGSKDDELLMEGLLGVVDGIRPAAFALAPKGVKISDLAVAVDGTIFASDPINGGVYAKLSGLDASLKEFVPPGTFRSPQGLATSADNSKLYVSDYRYGIGIVDLATRNVSRLVSDIPVILDGVDGLWRYGKELIAVQNGTSPIRISAFLLSDDGMRVVGHRILEQAHPDWSEPLGGSLDGDTLLYVGNGQWDRYVNGVPEQDKPPLPTQIRRLPLDP